MPESSYKGTRTPVNLRNQRSQVRLIGARVGSVAAPGEVLVSRTVTDLVAGSGIEFTDRGVHSLKGVPGGGSSMR